MPCIQLLVTGIVQGVGFRPFCARLARSLGLDGWVRNTPEGVRLLLEGPEGALASFRRDLVSLAPPLARIRSVREVPRDLRTQPRRPFAILPSEGQAQARALIPPDLTPCSACLAELFDSKDRRFRYPFLNCTDCGPRYSLIRRLPYDRSGTTLACFPQCDPCLEEYEDPEHRRFHAQPNACPDCGPRLWLADPEGRTLARGEEAIRLALEALREDRILAVKGLGGFHLACDPARDAPVAELRRRKHRPHKPFAVLVRDLEEAGRLVRLTGPARELLASPRCPILLCPRREDAPLSPLVAPRQDTLGVFLPPTPLHHLLTERFPRLLMTSGNRGEEPLAAGNREALASLKGVADRFLLHDRDIHNPVDDSVVALAGHRPLLVRRSRGYVPEPLFRTLPGPSVFAAGAEMKSAFALASGDAFFPGPYLGDLTSRAVADRYLQSAARFLDLLQVRPERTVCDLHPLYVSTRLVRELFPDLEPLRVPHHRAHLAALLADRETEPPLLGWVLDGTGYGEDGTVWGGELLLEEGTRCLRLGHLLPAPLPGGDRSVREPWRFAASLLVQTFGPAEGLRRAQALFPSRAGILGGLAPLLEAPETPRTSSCGRLFDGAAALLGLRETVSYDGQAAMELEACARGAGRLPFAGEIRGDRWVVDWRPAVAALATPGPEGTVSARAAAFHGGLAEALGEGARWAADRTGVRRVGLTGGCFQNRRLLSLVCAALVRRNLEPLVHLRLSCNDEAVATGQAWVASREG